MDKPGVIPILGVRTMEQTKDNLGVLDLALTAEQTARRDQAGKIVDSFRQPIAPSSRFEFPSDCLTDPSAPRTCGYPSSLPRAL